MNELVSVIVPVFNVEKELDICLDSIVTQTYRNLEIIIINDGSTDSSDKICQTWLGRDSRIIYIKNDNNNGPGSMRNLGISMANGTYIAFIDSDDWVDSTFIEKMYKKIRGNKADLVVCDYYEVQGNTKAYQNSNIEDCVRDDIFDKILFAGCNVWTKMVKKEIMKDNNILMPAIPYEDFAVNDIILLSCARIVSVKEALYYYRGNREGSIMNTTANHIYFPQTARYLLAELRKRNLYEGCKKIVTEQIIMHMRYHYMCAVKNFGQETFEKLEKVFWEFLQEEPALKRYYNLITKNIKFWGSYSLSRMGNWIDWNSNIQENRYNFSSIISIMAGKQQIKSGIHANPYRETMVKRDFDKSFWEDIEEVTPDFLFIDFLEERFDILQYGNSFATKSDAWEECSLAEDNIHTIERRSDECRELWMASCKEFAARLKKHFEPNQVILVRNYLCTSYGDGEQFFTYGQLDWIEQINQMLESYYQYFAEMFHGIHIIDNRQERNYTDHSFEYGVYPWHYNKLTYIDLSWSIAQKII